jgi:hypothetical protein
MIDPRTIIFLIEIFRRSIVDQLLHSSPRSELGAQYLNDLRTRRSQPSQILYSDRKDFEDSIDHLHRR